MTPKPPNTRKRLLWELTKALMAAQITKDKPMQRRVRRLLRKLEAQEENEETQNAE